MSKFFRKELARIFHELTNLLIDATSQISHPTSQYLLGDATNEKGEKSAKCEKGKGRGRRSLGTKH
jgi:hypothetical protein